MNFDEHGIHGCSVWQCECRDFIFLFSCPGDNEEGLDVVFCLNITILMSIFFDCDSNTLFDLQM
jgi:hypothetical protein